MQDSKHTQQNHQGSYEADADAWRSVRRSVAYPRRILIGVTGASGSVYAERLFQQLLGTGIERIDFVATKTGRRVMMHELAKGERVFADGASLLEAFRGRIPSTETAVRVFAHDDFFAPVASGTAAATDMIVIPCSMGSLGRIAHGLATNLLERSADVMLKEGRPLVICPREMPLNLIHLENMVQLVRAGARMLPTMPSFYHHPKDAAAVIDTVVGKILETLGIPHSLYPPWNSSEGDRPGVH